jgi:nucleoside 2-deoxyribosyltransferase
MAHQFSVERADELASAGPVNEEVTKAIIQSNLIVADLTGERPNCYYEAGFAHALGKPVIILAQTGTTRHFDIPGVEWHYWNSSEDLKPKFEKLLLGTLIESGHIS